MACKKTVERIIKNKGANAKNVQVGFLALNKKGQFGAYAIQKGFTYCVTANSGTKVYDSKYFY
jgi:N4-(beta-N-acetylglucosaminyl)-L-asparaginase